MREKITEEEYNAVLDRYRELLDDYNRRAVDNPSEETENDLARMVMRLVNLEGYSTEALTLLLMRYQMRIANAFVNGKLIWLDSVEIIKIPIPKPDSEFFNRFQP